VRWTGDGRDALDLLAKDPLPDLVLLDVMIPHVTGFAVLEKLRAAERTRALPVVMMTSFSRERDVAHGRELGANDYIIKPLMELDFLDRVARALGEHRPA
jgi:DNA-binding response OmpR family regulator